MEEEKELDITIHVSGVAPEEFEQFTGAFFEAGGDDGLVTMKDGRLEVFYMAKTTGGPKSYYAIINNCIGKVEKALATFPNGKIEFCTWDPDFEHI